jgi:hypothetical protein
MLANVGQPRLSCHASDDASSGILPFLTGIAESRDRADLAIRPNNPRGKKSALQFRQMPMPCANLLQRGLNGAWGYGVCHRV